MKKFVRLCAAAMSAIALAACGSGGGSTSTSTTTTTTTTTTVTSVTGNAAYAPTDPFFADQWHLKNTGQTGTAGGAGTAGEDLNVEKVWTSFKGTGVRIAIVDDRLDIVHEDLSPNAVLADSWDYLTGAAPVSNLITGNSAHGTSCGGLAAAAGGNSKGGVGVAMAAKLVGYNLLQAAVGANEADAMTRGATTNSVSSNSWGATDGTGTLQPSSATWQTAINTGITTGRSNKGIVYAWAGGNGAPTDRSDYDGQANYAGVIAVAALDDKGQKSSYSEPGSNVLVSAYGGEFCSTHTLTTTDITGAAGSNTAATAGVSDYTDTSYTKCMNGTSGATPEVSGAVALILEANPALTFRDVRIILATTARKNDATDAGWGVNGAATPLHINEKYGYGAVDAQAAVNAALGWTSVGGATTLVSKAGSNITAAAIADGTGTTSAVYGAVTTSAITLASSGISKIEFVEVTVDSNHLQFGDLKITLTSPAGTISTLTLPHGCTANSVAVACGNLLNGGFRFGVARLVNEAADGTWTLSVSDGLVADTGNLTSWNIAVYGH
ncbi:MAG: S8 family serine peptidase [Nitrospinae bacterium]|nr:S8 family serine peptidase [Nitrospinota bacterium]